MREIFAAGKTYQTTEKHGLKFGRVCAEWRDTFKATGVQKKGDGVSAILHPLGISKIAAYWWMEEEAAVPTAIANFWKSNRVQG